MERHHSSAVNCACLKTQLIRLLHGYSYQLHDKPRLEELAIALRKLYSAQDIQSACVDLQQQLPASLAEHAMPLSELVVASEEIHEKLANKNALAQSTRLLCEKIVLLWQNHQLPQATKYYIHLLEDLCNANQERAALLWNINNLLAWLALENQNGTTSRSNSLQAMFCARSAGNRQQLESSEFSLACALSCETPTDSLKDNFVELRSHVFGETSRLEVYQQHLVLLFSARDLSKRQMLASARWILDITTEYLSVMLPAQQHMLYCEEARYYAYKDKPKQSMDYLERAASLVEGDCPPTNISAPDDHIVARLENRSPVPTFVSVDKKELLNDFIRRYSAATACH